MTKKKGKSIAATLATATCSLLGNTVPEPVQAQEEPGWDFNTALLYYDEADDRVQDISFNFLAVRSFEDDRSLSLGFVFDTLTGPTPTGAIPFDSAQTFTRASGLSTYSTAAEQIPLDDTFLDDRYAISVNWEQPLGRLYTFDAGLTASSEYDYTHVGANVKLSRDFNKRNTTASIGLAFGQDDMDTVGGAPIPLSEMLEVGNQTNKRGNESKDVVDLMLGVTQVINRNFLVNLNYSFSESSGYLNDPYKFLSVVDAVTGDPVPMLPAPGTGPSHQNRFESRPDSRTKHSLYGQAKYYMNGKVLDASYRYMTDDWDIDSHTVDLRFRWPIGDSRYLEPHFRFYTQSHADFYRVSLTGGAPLPSYASADYRLGEFDAITVGLKYGWTLKSGNEMSARLEFYSQDGDAPQSQLIGNQLSRDLYPDLDAIIAQFSFRFGL
jgi:hypothetical protein